MSQQTISKIYNYKIHHIFFFGLIAVLIYFIPYLLLGQNVAIRVFDNLDSEIIYKIMAARKGYWLNYHALIPEIMNGLPRFCLSSGLNFTTLMFGLFPPFIAYLVNDFIMRWIGFIGIYLLMKNYIFRGIKGQWFTILFSTAYIFIPFVTIYGLTDLGQPLLLYSFLNILNKKEKVTDYISILLFPLFSWFVLGGFFIAVALCIILLIDWIRGKRINRNALLVITGYVICCLIVEYNLIIPMFEGFHTHREEMVLGREATTFSSFYLHYLWRTDFAAGIFYTFPIWLSVLCAFLFNRKDRKKIFHALLLFLILYTIVITNYYFGTNIRDFRLTRFYHLLDLCWMLLFGLSLLTIIKNGKKFQIVAICILMLQIAALWYRDVNYMTDNLIRKEIGLPISRYHPSYKAFFAEKQFGEVARYIGKAQSTYRILNVGILPAVSQYNGFYTLDSYQNNYPLAYKHQFENIEREELNKNATNKRFYEEFGNMCYIFPAEVAYTNLFFADFNKNKVLHNLTLNHEAMKAMHCEYVFSSAKIEHCEKSGLQYLHCFIDPKSHWDIWLYRVM